MQRMTTALVAMVLAGCEGAFERPPEIADTACVAEEGRVEAIVLGQLRGGPGQEDPTRMPSAAATAPAWLTLAQPRQVFAVGNDVYVADAGLGAVIRTDRFGQTAVRMARLPGTRVGGLAADRFGTLYLAVPAERAVVQIGRNGLADRAIGHDAALGAPIDVAIDETGNLYVADELGARVVVFDRVGQVVATIGERGGTPNPFVSVTAVATGPDGVYVLDATARRVFVATARGPVVPRVELPPEAGIPVALAVDRTGRVFIGTRTGSLLMVETSGTEALPLSGVPRLADLADLHLDDQGTLYLADAAAGTVYLLRVPGRCR